MNFERKLPQPGDEGYDPQAAGVNEGLDAGDTVVPIAERTGPQAEIDPAMGVDMEKVTRVLDESGMSVQSARTKVSFIADRTLLTEDRVLKVLDALVPDEDEWQKAA